MRKKAVICGTAGHQPPQFALSAGHLVSRRLIRICELPLLHVSKYKTPRHFYFGLSSIVLSKSISWQLGTLHFMLYVLLNLRRDFLSN